MENKSAAVPLHDTAASVTIRTKDDIRERQLSDLVVTTAMEALAAEP